MQTEATGAVETTCISQTGSIEVIIYNIYYTDNVCNIKYVKWRQSIYIMQTGATGAVETTCISQTGSIGANEECFRSPHHVHSFVAHKVIV